MTRILKREVVSSNAEKKFITGLIMSTKFCQDVKSIYKEEYLELEYAKRVAKWAFDYFKKYKESPKTNIQSIYDSEKENLKEDESEIIESFLDGISEQFSQEGLNEIYLLDQTKEYFRKRSLDILFTKGQMFVSAGKIKKAKKLLLGYREVSKVISDRFNPFDIDQIRNYSLEQRENRLFKFLGATGDLFGWFERDWLVAVSSPEKRGKSFWLEEFAFQAITNRLKVVLFSLEIGAAKLKERIYKRLTGLSTDEESGFFESKNKIIFPVFDCWKNQEGSCKKEERQKENKKALFEKVPLNSRNNESYQKKPVFVPGMRYRPCTICRDNSKNIMIARKKGYIPSYWFSWQEKQMMKIKDIENKAKAFVSMYGDNFRIKTFPAFSANSEDINMELDDLEYTEGFVPDVILDDYLDIHAGEQGGAIDRGGIDTIWKNAKNIAATRHCLYVTADQSTKKARDKKRLTQIDTSEDKRKDAHLDMRIGINQLEDEKKDMVMRLNVLFHRHMGFNTKREVLVLQQLGIGQPMLDSEWLFF